MCGASDQTPLTHGCHDTRTDTPVLYTGVLPNNATMPCHLQGSFYNLTLSWLIKHHFPPGPIHLTRTHVPTLPVYISVGNFKVQYMESLQKKGFDLYAAYGNTGTDVRAYEAAGIPKERCGRCKWQH